MKKTILLAVVVLLGASGLAQAQEGELHGVVGITYDTKYVWRGITVFGQKSAIHPFVDLDLMGTGFHLNAIGHRANASGYENNERWDYTLYYKGSCYDEETYATRYMLGYTYFNYPDLSAHSAYKSATDPGSADLQELFAVLSWPSLLGIEGLVPSYCIVKGWPSNSNAIVGANNANGGTYSGFAHVFMLDYALPVTGLTAEIPEQILNFHTEMIFNDGVDPRGNGGYTDSDWTHIMFGVTTDFDLDSDLTFTPGLYYQITMEDDKTYGVSPDHDITWASVTVSYKF